MNYIYIEDTRIDSLALDFVVKAKSMLGSGRSPKQIFVVGIGESGLKIAVAFLEAANKTSAFPIPLHFRALEKNGTSDSGMFEWMIPQDGDANSQKFDFNSVEELSNLKDTAILLIDGVVRTGRTLLSVHKAMVAKTLAGTTTSTTSVWSYAIAVNPTSCIIPTWFGTFYSPTKYVVLSRDDGTPNVAMLEVTKKVTPNEVDGTLPQPLSVAYPPVVLRAPEQNDCEFHVDFPSSMNRYKSVDRYFDHQTKSRRVFIIEVFNAPIGYVAFHVSGNTLWLDYILIDSKINTELGTQDIRPGAALIRFVSNYAQSMGCTKIGAWAIVDRLKFYTDRGFQKMAENTIKFKDGDKVEEYALIVRQLENARQKG
jgi:pyrimidine operon attenuation protein/uracil phosphoribosyltransferase